MLTAQQTDVYTDFASLAKLKNEAKEKSPTAIKEVAKQFESVFVGMMLKSMRQVKLADGILDSDQSEFYRDMYDQQLSIHLSGERGMGLAEVIERQLSPDQSHKVARQQSIADYERRNSLISAAKNSQPKANIETEKELASNTIKSKPQAVAIPKAVPPTEIKINSASDFVKKLRPYAEQAAKKLGVDANILIAQAALETGWGKHVIKSSDGNSSHNLFNIKADKSWKGQQTTVNTLEFKQGVAKKEMAGFRSYDSYQESFDDYVTFIQSNPRYKMAIKMAEKAERYMHELHQAGYATDPHYADKVIKIYHSRLVDNQDVASVGLNQASTSDNS